MKKKWGKEGKMPRGFRKDGSKFGFKQGHKLNIVII